MPDRLLRELPEVRHFLEHPWHVRELVVPGRWPIEVQELANGLIVERVGHERLFHLGRATSVCETLCLGQEKGKHVLQVAQEYPGFRDGMSLEGVDALLMDVVSRLQIRTNSEIPWDVRDALLGAGDVSLVVSFTLGIVSDTVARVLSDQIARFFEKQIDRHAERQRDKGEHRQREKERFPKSERLEERINGHIVRSGDREVIDGEITRTVERRY